MKAVAHSDSGILFFKPQTQKQPLAQELLQISHESVYLISEDSDSKKRPTHAHWFAEVFFIPQGEGSFIINGIEYPASKGDLVFVNPNITHTEYNRNRLEYFCLGISNIHFEVDSTTCVVNTREHYDEYLDILQNMLREFSSDDEDNLDFINNYFERFCLLIKRHFNYSLSPISHKPSPSENSKAVKTSAVVEIARGYMENNMRYDIDLDQLSKLTFVSKQHLIRLFTETLGYTPIQYLNRVRISKSMYSLMLRKDSIAEIADQFGFKSSYAYIKMFKRTTGYTPQQFRIKYANNIQEAERILSEISKIKDKKHENDSQGE